MDHSINITVYYEDTDAAGVVYYANYLRYFERCRTEWLRLRGYNQSDLIANQQIAFVVSKIYAEYIKPAKLDDNLQVDLLVTDLNSLKIKLKQHVFLIPQKLANEQASEIFQKSKENQNLICKAELELVSVSTKAMRPKRMNKEIFQKLCPKSRKGST